MTEYEAATLAFQNATLTFHEGTLAFQTAALTYQEAGLWIAAAHVAATLVIGAGQIGIVWYGIRAMNRASAVRTADRATAERAADSRERAADQRHAEAMRALEALIARTAPAAD